VQNAASPYDFDVTDDAAYKLDIFAPVEEWITLGACNAFFYTDPDFFFNRKTELTAKVICNTTCPDNIRLSCQAYALINNIPFGVWGGLLEEERSKMTTTDKGRAYISFLKRRFKEVQEARQKGLLLSAKPPTLRVVQ
jgi:hypothetical protein